MKIAVGFIFSNSVIQDLAARGLSFQTDESGSVDGYRAHRVRFADGSGFEIREILEEALYTKKFKTDHFYPREEELVPESRTVQPDVGSSFYLSVKRIIRSGDLGPGPLRTFFEIRKPSSLWALELEVVDFDRFLRWGRPHPIFSFESEDHAVIHLGPGCFDFLVRIPNRMR